MLNLSCLSKYYGDDRGIAIICSNAEELSELLYTIGFGKIDDLVRSASNDNFSRGDPCTVHFTLSESGLPNWAGWCDLGYYEELGIPEIPFELLRLSDQPEEPIEAYTEDELTTLWEGMT